LGCTGEGRTVAVDIEGGDVVTLVVAALMIDNIDMTFVFACRVCIESE
jgi:hypothetical protein